MDEKILQGLFLCSSDPNETLQELKPEWNSKIKLQQEEKLLIINSSPKESFQTFLITDVFPWKEELSKGIDHEKFCESFFVQPDLFLRLRPEKEKLVKEKLSNANIDFKIVSDPCLALDNSSKIDSVIELDKEAVVQDYNSQRIGNFFELIASNKQQTTEVWDCCAGSGGKSIMLYDFDPNIQLTVSDVRESILANLKKRFARAGIKNYKSFIADVRKRYEIRGTKYDIIICDAPCTGSGTWSRTPEQLFYFNPEKINEYSSLQKQIVSNVIPHLNNDGYFLYITCSVFKKENEEVIEFIKEKFDLELLKMPARTTRSDGEILKGYDKKADTMFAALLKRSL